MWARECTCTSLSRLIFRSLARHIHLWRAHYSVRILPAPRRQFRDPLTFFLPVTYHLCIPPPPPPLHSLLITRVSVQLFNCVYIILQFICPRLRNQTHFGFQCIRHCCFKYHIAFSFCT
ncbi:hypothetical protein BDZ89DRAFT_165132 [Hymenopellis radicata]|nr:hypothetical protein BDZ89DRAFT_165132 [Hymenopellis radicata]